MKQQFIRLVRILSLVLMAVVATAGTWSDNQFFYEPDLGARGPEEKANFETGLARVDAHLGKYKTLGDPNYSTLAEALTTIGSTQVTLTIPAGTVAVTAHTAIPGNIALQVQNGGKFEVASGVTLTINGTVEAGPYQIFSGTGAVILGGVSTIYDAWFASPPSTPEGAIAAPVGARFTKTTGSAPLVYVKESGTGNTGWIAASTLTHTHTPSQVALGNVTNDAQLKRAAGDINSFPEKSAPIGADLILIEDSANSYNKKKVQITNLPGGSGGSTTFTGLSDAPDSYSGQAGKVVRVNAGATALEFGNPDHVHANKTYLDAIDQTLASTSSPTFTGMSVNGNLTVSGTVDGVDVSSHKSRHEAGGADALAHQNLAGAGTNTHAQIDAHLSSTSNPHAVTATQVGAIANTASTVKDTHIDWGTGTGQVSADDIPDGAAKIIPTAMQETNWDNHLGNTNNPHGVTKAQVGLGNVTNDAQLKRAAGDISSFPEKSAPTGADLILIEDSANSFNKKKVQITNLPGGSGSTTFTGLTDTPSSYSGQAGKALRVNSGATALEFYNPSSSGGIKPFIILGESGYTTLSEALTTIGSTETTLVVPAEAGAVAVTSNCTIGGNIRLKVEKGAYFQISDGITFTINGPLEAGAYKIFQWTGTGKVVLTESPTDVIDLPWFGAQPGTGNDCAAAFAKIMEATTNNNKTIRIPRGVWRIASPVIFNKLYGVALVGEGLDNSGIYIDVGSSNNGLTFGNTTSGSTYQYRLENLSIVGPANSCKNALRFVRAHELRIKNVNIYAGATEYAISFEGSLWGDIEVFIGHNYGSPLYSGAARPANGIAVTRAADGYGTNVLRIKVYGTYLTNGVYIKDTLSGTNNVPGYPIIISGSLEACTGYTIYGERWWAGEIRDFYMTDLNQKGICLKNSRHIRIVNTECYQDGYEPGVTLQNSKAIEISNGTFGSLNIDAACRGTVLKNIQVRTPLVDDAPDTQYMGTVWRRDSVPKLSFNTKVPDRINLLDNARFNRWQTDRPDGWDVNSLTWTQCGTGQTDTTNHASDYSAKLLTSGGAANSYYTLTANQLKAVLGKIVNFSIWGKMAAGQAFTNYPRIYVSPTVPAWTGTTAFKTGEAVRPIASNSRQYICITAGTTGSAEPTWPTTAEETITDGTVTWMCVYDSFSSTEAAPFTADDVGNWKRAFVAGYIPKNASVVKLRLTVYQQTSGSEATIYWAEPCLMTGWQGPDSVVSGQDEHAEYVSVGANRIRWGSVIPTNSSSPLYTQWAQQGDVVWNTGAAAGGSPGWVCTTSGKNNAGAVWKAMANLGN